MKKNIKIIIGVLLLIGIVGVLAYFGIQQSTFNFTTGKVYLPNYVSIFCGRLPTQIDDSWSINDKGSSTCGYKGTETEDNLNIEAYVPYGCNYIPQKSLKYKIVSLSDSCNWGIFEDGTRVNTGATIKVDYGKKICFNEDSWGSTLVKVTADKYGLRISSANGKVIFTKNCDLQSNIQNLKDIDYIPGFTEVPMRIEPKDSVDHYINGYSEVVNDKDVVTFEGNKIYIYAINSYYPIEKSADGYDFANSLKPRTNNKLICVPSQNPLCIGGTEIKKLEDQSCSGFNLPEGYVSIGGNEECTFKCINGKLVKDDCRIIAKCPADKPYRNPITNVCESSASPRPIDKNECAWYEDSYTKIEKDYGAFYWRAIVPFVDAKETPISGCRTSGWVYMLGFGVIIIVLGSVLIFSMKKRVKKK